MVTISLIHGSSTPTVNFVKLAQFRVFKKFINRISDRQRQPGHAVQNTQTEEIILKKGKKSAQKSVEIGVMIESAIFLDGSGGVEFVQSLRLHRTFQVKMQFGFGQVEREIVHT